MVNEIVEILSKHRFVLDNEKEAQYQIGLVMHGNDINTEREYRLDKKNIPDFFIDGLAIEVKIKGNAKSIYKQCERYCKFDQVKELLLITNRSMGFPKEINGKPCYYLNLGKAWL